MAYDDTVDYPDTEDNRQTRAPRPGQRQPGVVYPTTNTGAPESIRTGQPNPVPPPNGGQTTTILKPDENKYPGTGPQAGVTWQAPAGMDPRLAQLYKSAGLAPGARGSGFADWEYWQELANGRGGWDYVLGRLGDDLAGRGTDQPTGTPGQGAWSNSGRNAPTGGGPTAGSGGYTPLTGTQSMSSQNAINYLNGINQSIGGGNLTPEQIQQAAQFVGYQEGQPVTGDQLNRIVAEMYRRAGRTVPTGPAPGQPGTGPTPPPLDMTGDTRTNGVPDNGNGTRTVMSPSTTTGLPSTTAGLPTTTKAGGDGDLLKYLMGRGTGQITDDTLPNLKVDANDPLIKNQVDAFRNEQTRSQRSQLSREAEKGNSITNLNPIARSLAERGGAATGAFEGQVMQGEINARRQEIQQALQLGVNYLTEQQRQALQRELQELDIQSRHFMQLRDLQERGYEFDVNDQFRNSPLYGG